MQKRSLGLVLVVMLAPTRLCAQETNSNLTLEGMLAGAYQCQRVSANSGGANLCRGALPLQPMAEWHLTPDDEVFFKLGFNVSNGINTVWPFSESPWAADMKDDLKNINGRGRDHLLLAGYEHTYILEEGHKLKAVVGLIDATEYLDKNAYANDGYTQFMNSALTNGPNVFLPSFDRGIALNWQAEPWSIHGVVMNVGANDDGHTYDFAGVQLAYTAKHPAGDNHYRLVLTQTSRDFLNPAADNAERRYGALLSIDYAISATLGWFLRLGREHVAAALQHDAIYSGGINLNGKGWQRPDDNIGIGYAYLHGGNSTVRHTQIAESYYRWVMTERVALSADLQFVQDSLATGITAHGWVYGIRSTVQF